MDKFLKYMLKPFLFNSLKIVNCFLMNHNLQKKTATSKQPFGACQPYGTFKAMNITTIKMI